MKKHDEGYALILVLVIFVVLSILSFAVMSIGLTNLKNQKEFQKRMEDKYAAQGQIEKIIAVLSEKASLEVERDKKPEEPLENWFKAIAEVSEAGGDLAVEATVTETTAEGLKSGTYSGTVTLDITQETMRIRCKLAFYGSFAQRDTLSNPSVYDITPDKVEYLSYDISRISEGGGAE